jgi:hypothetical protein
MEMVCLVCNNIRKNSKPDISFQSLLTNIRKEFRNQGFDIKIKSLRDSKLEQDEFCVKAYYDPIADHQREVAIEIYIHHNFTKDLLWGNQLHVTSLLEQVFDATVHEYKHQRQSRKRSYEVFNYSNTYLDDPDEIDAYAVSIAIELCRSLGKYRALRFIPKFMLLSKLKFNNQYVSPILQAYVSQFGDTNNPIIKRLAKKIYVRLHKVDTDYIFM